MFRDSKASMYLLRNLLSTGIIFCPNSNKLVEMVSSENGGVSGQVIKVVHDDSHEQVEHQERTEIEQEQNGC